MALAPPFWSRVEKSEGCWLWTGSKTSAGYGDLNFMYQHVLAHRLSYTLSNGEIPKGYLVLHRCDTPLCVRPDHLFLGTDADNMNDKAAKLRNRRSLTLQQIREVRALLGTMPQADIARKLKLATGTVSKIKLGKSYGRVA